MQSRAQWISTIPYSCNERAGLHHDNRGLDSARDIPTEG